MAQRQRIRPSTFARSHRLGSILGFTVGLATLALLVAPAQAQIQGDGTLGTQVNMSPTAPCTGFCQIDNGTTRGSNLFHSFRQFSLPNGDVAAFVTAPTIQNVIVRVTGIGNPFISNINGTIATFDPAFNLAPRNFFLLNPNGIVFGPGATLLNGGSFLASTAERMLFQDGTVFNTRDQTPNPLLTLSVPVGLQFGQTPGNIQMQGSFLSAGITDDFSDFALVGGNVSLDNTTIRAPGQRVVLGSVSSSITVSLEVQGNALWLQFPAGVERENIAIVNQSQVDVLGEAGGSLAIHARNLDVSGGSLIVAGIGADGGTEGSQAGDIVLSTTGILQITTVVDVEFMIVFRLESWSNQRLR